MELGGNCNVENIATELHACIWSKEGEKIMTMSLSIRKLILTLHVITSVGWLGSVVAYIPVAAYVLTNQDAKIVQSTIQIMDLIVVFIVVPMAFASLITGIVLSLGTSWGLFRHYWVLLKFLLTCLAIFVLISYTQELREMASIASSIDMSVLQDREHIAHTIGGLLVLLVASILSVYKPKGLTKYGWRKRMKIKNKADTTTYSRPRWIKVTGITAIVMLLLITLLIIVLQFL